MARGQHPSGATSRPSGRFMLGQGLGGRVKGSGRPPGINLAEEGLSSADEILHAVRAALQAEDRSRADRLIAAWKVKARRTRDLAALEADAASELEAGRRRGISDDELAADVAALLGRTVRAV